MDLPADDRLQIMKHIRQTDLRFFQMDLSALNPAHIQDIIDQGKQMVTGASGTEKKSGTVHHHMVP